MSRPYSQKELVDLVEKSNLGERGFARHVDIEWAQFSRYYAKGKKPTAKVIARIQEKYPKFLKDEENEAISAELTSIRSELAAKDRVIELLDEKVEAMSKTQVDARVLQNITEQLSYLGKEVLSIKQKVTAIQESSH
jgi:hypothetical protein